MFYLNDPIYIYVYKSILVNAQLQSLTNVVSIKIKIWR